MFFDFQFSSFLFLNAENSKSGGLSATHLNLGRTVCRRAERAVVILLSEGRVDKEVGKYLNRLSDLLFAATRLHF